MTFSSLIGNESVKGFLEAVLSQKTALQVFLFVGPEGVGKKTFALTFTEMLFGQKHSRKIQTQNHPDLLYFRPEGKTFMHPVSSIRTILEEVAVAPFEATFKVVMIEDVERMLPTSSNALLKILEEPPSYVRFILLTSKPNEVLSTIISRCSTVSFYPIEDSILSQYLIEKKGVSSEKVSQIVLRSQGSFSRALELLDVFEDPIRMAFLEIIKDFFLLPPSFLFVESLIKLEKLLEKKTEKEPEESFLLRNMDRLFEDLLFWVRDLHVLKETSCLESVFHQTFLGDLQEQVKTRPIPALEKILYLIEEARLALQRSSKPKVVLEQLFIKSISNEWP